MRVCSLGSGSSGNATLVEVTRGISSTRVLIDCGFGLKQLDERLARWDLSIQDIDAVFVTHEHSDHVGCARQLALQEKIPLWLSRGTYAAIGNPDLNDLQLFAVDGEAIVIQDICLHPFTVAHDAREPLQLVISDGNRRLGILTDIGHITPHVIRQMQGLHTIILEFNHDENLLRSSKYPHFLKDRIKSDYGHLSNLQAFHFLQKVTHQDLQQVIAAHLSQQNNQTELVRNILQSEAGNLYSEFDIADAYGGFPWKAV